GRMQGDTLHRLIRNNRQEEKSLDLLYDTGLAHADDILFEYVLGECTRHLTFHKPLDWFEFSRVEIPKLEKAGWRVEKDASFQFCIVEPEDWYTDAKSQKSGQDW